ncbi:hypothetical protein FAM18124_02109 [Lacticaseibacillus paracasei]|uniref:DUF1642 domain-containing protein n=1 Tax=Lacticaseibacillus paracasei TaxID=1597 RepID=UPI000F4391D9|nr:DUF1642 domain-containing protein [Lacticaseibacillus paracasei]RND62132.1 hypothetical protein FAM18124_02109 [Lacticaseibacillus paracasei]RND68740.1 hypothetical protein FAM18129_02190 [Lacticaseibacillus paracasei]
MSEEKLYAVKNDKGEWMSLDGTQTEIWYSNNPTLFKDKSYAEAQSMGRKAHVVELVEPKKVVLTKEQAEIVDFANGYYLPARYISNNSSDEDEELLMNAYVNGYTVAKEKKYLVYKELGGKQKNKQVAQAYRSTLFPDTIIWLIMEHKIMSTTASDQFTEAEIEHYGLQDCEKEEVTDDAD